jgi:class 3 adenylate cyclase/tetratricopeptide (TPR) repeat protein
MFCDLVGSTPLSEQLDPEELREVVQAYQETCAEVIHRFEGHIAQYLGDGLLVYFGYPLAHEDDAQRAIRTGLGIVEEMERLNTRLEQEKSIKLAVRVGIHTGRVVVGEMGGGEKREQLALGDTPNIAARVQGIAKPDTVAISSFTYGLIQGFFVCQDLGFHTLKGISQPMAVYQVLRESSIRSRFEKAATTGLTPLVGRDKEITALTGCIERLVAGRGGIVSVIGEAGVGKSRLVAEVRRQMTDRDLLWLEGSALSFTQTISYWPFLEILKSYAGITEEDGKNESWVKLEKRVTDLFPEQVVEILPYLATLLALDVKGELEKRVKYLDEKSMGRQILRTSRRFFERLAQEHPVVLVFEDWHWADQSSAELLEHLLPLVETVSLLICVVGRPDGQSPVARLREIAAQRYADRYTEIPLSLLSLADSAQLVKNLLESDDLPPRVREMILGKAEGNPLFLEEMIRALMDLGVLVPDKAAGGWKVTAQMEQITIPNTLQGVIIARIDRLEEDVKQMLKLASVIGRSFFYRVMQTIAEAERELDRHLTELQHLEFIREKRRIPELEYIFKHVLVQEAAYESILVQRRRQLHRRVGECIEALFADHLEEFYSLLAYHYTRAEEWEKAQNYLLKAGDQAGKVAADAEALAHYQQSLEAYARVFGDRWDPLQRAVLERKMGEALFRRGDHQQALEYLQRALTYLGSPFPTSRWGIRLAIARQLIQQVGHRLWPGLFLRQTIGQADPVAEERSRIYGVMGRIDFFVDPERLVLDTLMGLNISERSSLSVGVVQGSGFIGLILDLVPAFWLAERYHRGAVALAEQIQHPLATGSAYYFLACHESFLGKWDIALEHLQRSAAACWEAGDFRGWGAAIQLMSLMLCYKGDLTRALKETQELIRVGQDVADRQILAWGLDIQGRALRRVGALDQAAVSMQQAIELYKTIPDHNSIGCTSGDLGQFYLRQGKLNQTLAMLKEIEQLIPERGIRGAQAVHPLLGLTEAYLVAAEQAKEAERAGLLRKARRVCQAALKQCKIFRGGLPHAMRLQGTYEWLKGKPADAQKWWQWSLAVAEELGARYDLGMTYLEMGRRLGEQTHLERAEAIFTAIGATLDLAKAQELRQRGKSVMAERQ